MVSRHVDEDYDHFISRSNDNSQLHLYVKYYTESWNYTVEKPKLGETVTNNRRVYIHTYYNGQHCADDRDRFNHLLDRCEEELLSGKTNPDHENMYRKYFVVHETVRGKKISYNEDAITKAEKEYGYFAFMSNDIRDLVETLKVYRLRDRIKKSLGNLKERLSMRMMSVSSGENFEGRLFVQFIALELMSYIKK